MAKTTHDTASGNGAHRDGSTGQASEETVERLTRTALDAAARDATARDAAGKDVAAQGDSGAIIEPMGGRADRPARERAGGVPSLSDHAARRMARDWRFLAREQQWPPEGDWRTWLMLGGRGSGKTRGGAEWIARAALEGGEEFRVALVGETYSDVREVMVDGPAGLLRSGAARPRFEPSRRRLVWPGGAEALMFSSEDPDALRGPQFHAAWCDELAKWRNAEETWDMLQFGLRLGDDPRQVVTTTPRPVPLLKRLLDDEETAVTRMRTRDNAANLAASFLRSVERRYAGSRLGRQELDGELIEAREDALWSRAMLDRCRLSTPPSLARVVVAVDPAVTARRTSDATGIVVAGMAEDGRVVVLRDSTVSGVSPAEWGAHVAALYHEHAADCVIAETNQGGDMVAALIHAEDAGVPVRPVRATRGKWTRAEPVAALYERGRVAHLGTLKALEDEMCLFGPDGLAGGRSPDRVDALVWAVTALALTGEAKAPRVRALG